MSPAPGHSIRLRARLCYGKRNGLLSGVTFARNLGEPEKREIFHTQEWCLCHWTPFTRSPVTAAHEFIQDRPSGTRRRLHRGFRRIASLVTPSGADIEFILFISFSPERMCRKCRKKNLVRFGPSLFCCLVTQTLSIDGSPNVHRCPLTQNDDSIFLFVK